MAVKIIAVKEVKEGIMNKYLQEVRVLVEESLKEEGNISYNMALDINNPNIVIFIETWESKEYILDIHCSTKHVVEVVPHLKKYYEKEISECWWEEVII